MARKSVIPSTNENDVSESGDYHDLDPGNYKVIRDPSRNRTSLYDRIKEIKDRKRNRFTSRLNFCFL